MSDENAPAEETTPAAETTPSAETAPSVETAPAAKAESDEVVMPSAGKQIAVMGIIVVGITIVLGGGVLLSMWLG